jgi:hypothetical protein
MRCASFTLSVAVAAVLGCTTLKLDYQRLPAPEALASIREGFTTRSEVLQLLGPPEELRRPSPFERSRLTSHQHRRILEGRDVFGRDFYTYASERHNIETFGLLPVGLSLLRISWASSREDRWRIEFDENDVVHSVSHVDEISNEAR